MLLTRSLIRFMLAMFWATISAITLAGLGVDLSSCKESYFAFSLDSSSCCSASSKDSAITR